MDTNLFKRKNRHRLTGEMVESDKWSAYVADLRGQRVRVTLSESVSASRKAVAALVDAINDVRAGSTVVPDDLPPVVQETFLRILEKANHKLARVRAHSKPLSEHLDDYVATLTDNQRQSRHISDTRARIEALAAACRWHTLADISAEQTVKTFERWRAEKDHSPRTRNAYLTSMRSFINWCMRTDPQRLDRDPLAQVRKVNEDADIRRERRALSEDEIQKLLEVARARPLQGAMTIARGERKGQVVGELTDDYRRKLEDLGRQRSLQYQTLITLGLRHNELRKLRWCDLDLTDNPSITIWGKGQRFETLPVAAELAQDLTEWRQERKPQKATELVFDVPGRLVDRLRKDLEAAGIPYQDELGRYLDVHALRHTTATRHARAGTAPRVAQALMRHSSLELTMKVYTDPKLLNERAAADALPSVKPKRSREAASG